ncbi:MAG: hypothetical protein A2Z25_20690 [Planctomycetes bacterium RBG_16_55_9]|nr:MAG: hypothetical protein A2Z25_20690 [Planctomycetes bacterium RBG_16_55_9]
MDVVNEKTSTIQPCTFTDELGAPVTPTSATYSIHDESGYEIVAPLTAFTPPDIIITATHNRILDSAKSAERRVITVHFTYGSGKEGSGEIMYIVKNLLKVS